MTPAGAAPPDAGADLLRKTDEILEACGDKVSVLIGHAEAIECGDLVQVLLALRQTLAEMRRDLADLRPVWAA